MSKVNRAWLLGSIVAMSALLTLLFAVASATADEIVYSCGYDICTINPDEPSGSRVDLTPGTEAAEESPSWSPDGKWIAYSADYKGLMQVWVIGSDEPASEAEAVEISDNPDAQPEWEEPPSWSPDSSLLAWEENYLSGHTLENQHHVFVAPFDGSVEPVPIGALEAAGQSTHPSWTPGEKIVFARNSLYSANPDGSEITQFAGSAFGIEPVVSPNGKYVAVVQSNSVVVYNTDGSGSVTMAKKGKNNFSDISWSPDSTRIVWVDAENSGDDGLWVAPVDKSNEGHLIKAPTGWVTEFDPAFSPDGTRIAFSALPVAVGGHKQIFVAPAAGGEATQITFDAVEDKQPFWKPCEGCAVPPPNEGGSPGGGSGGGGGNRTGGAVKDPRKVRVQHTNRVAIAHNQMSVGIDCNAQGGHPELLPPELRKLCHVEAFTEYEPDTHTIHRVQLKRKRPIVFAKGSTNVPLGKSGALKLKLTGAGKKYAKPGKTLKLKLVLKLAGPEGESQTVRQTIRAAVPKRKKKK